MLWETDQFREYCFQFPRQQSSIDRTVLSKILFIHTSDCAGISLQIFLSFFPWTKFLCIFLLLTFTIQHKVALAASVGQINITTPPHKLCSHLSGSVCVFREWFHQISRKTHWARFSAGRGKSFTEKHVGCGVIPSWPFWGAPGFRYYGEGVQFRFANCFLELVGREHSVAS